MCPTCGTGRISHRSRPVHRPAARQAHREAPGGPPWLAVTRARPGAGDHPPAIVRPVREPPGDGMALEASWRGGSVGMNAGRARLPAGTQAFPGTARFSGQTDMSTVQVAPAAAEERRSSRAFRHRPRRHLPRLCAARPHRHRPRAERAPGPRSADPHPGPRQLLPERAPAAPRAGRANYPKIAVAYTQIATIATDDHHTLQEFRASVGAQWTFLSDPGRTVQQDLDIAGVHRPRAQPDDPAHAGAQAGTGHPQHL